MAFWVSLLRSKRYQRVMLPALFIVCWILVSQLWFQSRDGNEAAPLGVHDDSAASAIGIDDQAPLDVLGDDAMQQSNDVDISPESQQAQTLDDDDISKISVAARVVDTKNFEGNFAMNAGAQYVQMSRPVELSMFVHNPADCRYISKALVEHGTFQSALIKSVLNVMRGLKGEYFMDIGAHIGVFSLAAAKSGIPVVAFEPLKYNTELLAASVGNAGLQDKVHIFKAAVAEERGKSVCISVHGTGSADRGNGRVISDQECEGVQPEKVERVPLTTIDHVMEVVEDLSNVCFGVVKIDVEGYEPRALMGAAETVFREECPPCMVIAEFSRKQVTGQGSTESAFFDVLEGKYGYTCTTGREPVGGVRSQGDYVCGLDVKKHPRCAGSIVVTKDDDDPATQDGVVDQSNHVDTSPESQQAQTLDDDDISKISVAARVVDTKNFEGNFAMNAGAQYVQMSRPVELSMFVHNPADCRYISKALVEHGTFQSALIKSVLDVMRGLKGEYFMDIGAHIGVFSLAAAKSGIPVVAFEPLKYNTELLAASVGNAGLQDKVHIFKAAVAEERGKSVCISVHGTGSADRGNGRVISDQECEGVQPEKVERVPLTTIDHVMEVVEDLSNVCFGVVKIDVEGYEPRALMGAAETVFREECPPCMVIAEFSRKQVTGQGSTENAFFDVLEGKYGYTCTTGREPVGGVRSQGDYVCGLDVKKHPRCAGSIVVTKDDNDR